jgi:Ni,Fe-hydrogenase maturation factor
MIHYHPAFYVVAIKDPYTFGEQLTPEVERDLPAAASRIAGELAAVSAPSADGKRSA